ncbi:hypothetical protein [Clostridium aminobutyricum]|uniref:Uncharacterized protein n=1 Tax=Clostridium aminobutyricum TaxID=33953 RepID=A0A939IHS1_CLOAM|nr:hypothetical protein [Clostridium aminobutyricum]MBN7772331.1 hypothetical protein [Clostridium aminobutyricum]
MKRKALSIILLSIGAVIGGMIFNFQEFLMGSPANAKNLIVTFLYIASWVLVLVIGTRMKSRRVLTYGSIFWVITLFLAVVTIYVNVTGASADWALPFAILLLGQWYGINFFAGSFLAASIIIAVISLAFSATAIILRRSLK